MTGLSFRVYGIPAPQGSKRHIGRGVMLESSKKVAPWRQDVVYAALEAKGRTAPLAGPVVLTIAFYLPRPKTAKATTPAIKRPDLDKLIRSTCDALTTANVYADDAQVVEVVARKVYSDDAHPAGARIAIEPAT